MRKTVLMARVALALCGCVGLGNARVAQAQQTSLFSGASSELTLNDMRRGTNADWRLVFVSPDGKMRDDVKEVNLNSERLIERDIMLALGAMPDVYYTQGAISTVGSESYLVAYRLSYTPEELNQPFRQLEVKYPRAKMETMSRDELVKAVDDLLRAKPLYLTMLNLRLVGGVVTLHAFDADEQLGLIEKRIGQEIDKSQAERKQAAVEAARVEAARVEAARKAAAAKKGARPASSKTRPATRSR